MTTLVANVGGLRVTREGTGLRFTIPTAHSSALLTREQSHEVTAALVKLFRKQPEQGGGS